jgi:hypothetical protein
MMMVAWSRRPWKLGRRWVTAISKSEISSEIQGQLWQGIEDYHGLVGARHDSFGDGD